MSRTAATLRRTLSKVVGTMVLALALALTSVFNAQPASGDQMPPQVYGRPDRTAQTSVRIPLASDSAGHALPLVADDDRTPNVIRLPPLSREVLADKIETSRPEQIGFTRQVPKTRSAQIHANSEGWQKSATGEYAYEVSVQVPGAVATRLALNIGELPDLAILRFGNEADGPRAAHTTSGADVLALLGLNRASAPADPRASTYWSPMVQGEQMTFRLHLPAGVSPREVRLTLTAVAHVYDDLDVDPASRLTLNAVSSGFCQLDVMCSSAEIVDIGTGVVRIVFVSEDGLQTCSASLLADADPSTDFHLLTAHHCVPDQITASSVVIHWHYRSASCNSFYQDPLYEVQQTGTTLLSTVGGDHDSTLLRTNGEPPYETFMAGWDASSWPTAYQPLIGIHHPGGDWQKVSMGTVGPEREDCDYDGEFFVCVPDEDGHYLEIEWVDGLVEPGSSGSGAFSVDGYIWGTAAATNSTCLDVVRTATYASFADAYAAGDFGRWLMRPPASFSPDGSAKNLSTRGLVTPTKPMHGGIVVDGDAKVLITARGPSMGVAETLADTTLELFQLSTGQPAVKLMENDNWPDSPSSDDIASLTANNPLDPYEAALLVNLSSGAYTGVARDYQNNDSGEVLLGFTLIDDGLPVPKPKNLSTRGLVTPSKPMHGGIVVEGGVKVLITARGPTMGVATALSDTTLALYDIGGGKPALKLQENDEWWTSANADEIMSLTGDRPLDDQEAAFLVELPAGAYTAVARDYNNDDTGEVLLGFTLIPQ